jgi:hypothetical protein
MRSKTTIIVFVAVVALAALTTLLMSIERGPRAAPSVSPAPERDAQTMAQRQPVALESPARQAATEQVTEAPTLAPTQEPARSPEVVENETQWAVQYADKTPAELLADAQRLDEESKQEIDAEVEKRFQDGRYETIPQGSYSRHNGALISRGRGDANGIRIVDLFLDKDAKLFVKQRKAGWLRYEASRRPN